MAVTPAHWKRLSPLLDAALDLDPAEREAWLAGLPQDQADLREPLRELLAGRPGIETDDFLNRLPPFSAAPQALTLTEGSVVGPYRLLRELGAGGSASVWLAERVDGAIQRKVALKLPHLGLVDRGIAERIARERDILAGLEHPNIARLYDAGVDERGRPYMAIEFVDGVSPDEYCRAHHLDLRAKLELFVRILRAVAFAHARLIVHRDLKPSNILVAAGAEVRLLDFGIARLLQPDTGARPAIERAAPWPTIVGGAALTPAYAAPEQFTRAPVTVATDVYSLGVILYELLTGASPYAPDGRSLGAYEHEVLHAEPPLMSRTARPAESAPLRGDLDAIVAKALEKKPQDRYASVEAFANDIERHLASQPIDARPRSFAYVARKFARRNALPLAIGVAVIAVLTGALGVAAVQWRDAERQRAMAVERLANAQAASLFTSTVLIEGMQPGESLSFEQLIERSEEIARQAGRNDVRTRVFAADFLATWYRANGQYRKADALLTSTIDSLPADRPELGKALRCARAEIWAQLGRGDEGRLVLDREIATPGSDEAVQAGCLIGRSYFAAAAGDGAGAMDFGRRALASYEASGVENMYARMEILLGIGAAYGLTNDYESAHRQYVESLQLLERNGRERGRAAANLHDEWASVWMNSGNFVRALEELDRSFDILRELTPNADLSDDRRRYRRARILAQLGRFAEADAEVAGARMLSETRGNVVTIAGVQLAAAEIALSRGDFEEALKLLDGAGGKMRAANLPPGHVLHTRYTMWRGATLLGLQRHAEAREQFTNAIAGYEARECCHPQISFALSQRAEARLEEGDVAEARGDADRARELAQSSGKDSFSRFTGHAWYVTARIEESRGNARAARDAYAKAAVQLAGSIGDAHPETLRAREAIRRVSNHLTTQNHD
jgi:eukaryotic-like serine/threonine-protein kinase